jgi:GABA(A) receptor-associated protein
MDAAVANESASTFRARSLESRMEEAERVRLQYPARLPCIVTRSAARSARSLLGGGGSDLPALDKYKYLVPDDFTVGQLIYVIRKRMRVPPETAVFVYVGAVLPSSTTVISELYSTAKDVDGFLYLTFAGESAFGA